MACPQTSVIIPTYNGWDILSKCLPTVRLQDWPNFEILVVDDCSQDGTTAKIAQAFPDVRILTLEQNLGFAGACNAGVKATHGEYVALLNNDVLLPPDFVRRMVTALEEDPNAALAGPAVYNLNMDMSHYPYNGSMSLTGTVIHNVFRDNRVTFGAAGCALVFKRDIVGLPFDPDYGFFHEEIYLAWRTRLQGYTVRRLPDVVVEHKGGATLGNLTDDYRFLLERNRCLNFLTLFSRLTRARIWPLMLLARLLERISDCRAGRSFAPIRRARDWVRKHKSVWRLKRSALQSLRRVPDKDIIRWMSYKITNHKNLLGGFINSLAWVWCRLVALKTWESTGACKALRRGSGT